ncbi:ribosome biogenesis protein BMS1 homolog isoform X2 [Papaver somniferum]|uniref:ribosome biogenesis protein BMS1 homolog isoform X2 n=1 Tax=Papaver somniferum TaxID=3469 RepID=UPI000E701352|nr:ribosome biogenesis protein BMS1 homolog isoform X2 [Papaver somniferum]
MASSSLNQQEEDTYVKHGLSYVKIYKNKKCDEGFTNDHHHNSPHPPSIHHTSEEERPPYVIVVHGPPKVGKTLLIKCLEDHFSRRNVAGPSRCFLLGDKRRIQFVECPNNVNGMIDAAKYADAVMFLIDAGYGFEMETFEFLELLKVHGMPKVMGVLTYLDSFKDEDVLAKTRQNLLDQFQTNIHNGAKAFCLSGRHNAMYLEHEISELASFLSTMEFHPLSWRAARPYMLVDLFEDVTPLEKVQMDKECPRDIMLEGYLRGCDIENGSKVHIAGVGDFPLASVTSLTDPFALPSVDTNNLKIECFRAGTYLRFEFHDVPFEMVKNHDPCQPILVGGITVEEAKVGYMQVKLEPHSWHMKLLKSKDPIIVSVGWRRYQTRPIYTLEDCHGRNRVLKYTLEDMPCLATFWGPLAPTGTELAVVQSLADNKAAFRILAKAPVLEFNHDIKIVKKRKRIGTPYKIFKKTALIKDMFTSDLEIANFKDAKIQTARGISGMVDKPAGKSLTHGLEGIAKCTFKHKIRKRDTVFMHVYEQVEVPRFFNPIMRGPEPPDRIWHSVVDTYELTRASDLCVPANLESYYKREINPFHTRDLEFYSRWPRLMVALRRATSEEDKLSIKRQIEDFEIVRDERRRERELEATAPRRQTVEQVRAVRFIEKPKDTEKRLALMSDESLRHLSEGLVKKFIEYEKQKQKEKERHQLLQ